MCVTLVSKSAPFVSLSNTRSSLAKTKPTNYNNRSSNRFFIASPMHAWWFCKRKYISGCDEPRRLSALSQYLVCTNKSPLQSSIKTCEEWRTRHIVLLKKYTSSSSSSYDNVCNFRVIKNWLMKNCAFDTISLIQFACTLSHAFFLLLVESIGE